MYRLTANFSDVEYQDIRSAGMRGKLDGTFTRASNGDVTFRVINPWRFCGELERVVDFGATSAIDVFELQRLK